MGASSDAAVHMDGIYRWQVGIYDLTRKYYLFGRDRLIRELRPPAGGTLLEVGCGTGRNLILAARAYPHARFFGFDISKVMLRQARRAIAEAGLADRITLKAADAAAFDPEMVFGMAGFDRVFCSYTLSMIPPWREALGRALTATRPDGEFHVVDFGGQEGLPGWFGAGLRAWLRRFSVEPRVDLAAALERLASEEGRPVRLAPIGRGYAVSAVAGRRAGA